MGWDVSRGIEGMDHNFLTGTLEGLVQWARARSIFPATFGLACCAIEMMAVGASRFDLRTGQWALFHERNTPMYEIWTYSVSPGSDKVYYAVWGGGATPAHPLYMVG